MHTNKKLAGMIGIIVLILVIISYNTLGAKEEEKTPLFPNDTAQTKESEPSTIYVDIKGEIRKPGVYKLSADTRLFTLIEKAGGITQAGSNEHLNLARKLHDGEMIWIDGKNSLKETPPEPSNPEDERININTASQATLETLPNIGPASARAIIEYRETHQGFTSVEVLLEVSGIGPATLEAIREFITI